MNIKGLIFSALSFFRGDSAEYSITAEITEIEKNFCDMKVYFNGDDPCKTATSKVFSHAEKATRRNATENGFDQPSMPVYLPPEWEALSLENRTKLQKILRWDSVGRWDFNVWELDELSGGKSLLFLGWTLMASPYAEYAMANSVGENNGPLSSMSGYYFADKFNIQVENLFAFMKAVEDDYQDVTYHNRVHAADVFQTVHTLLQMGAKKFVDDLQIFSVLLAAAGHDVHHPGRNNMFQVNAKTEYSTLYNDSCLEHMHASSMVDRFSRDRLKPEADISSGFLPEQRLVVENLLKSTILRTDMKYHFKLRSEIEDLILSATSQDEVEVTRNLSATEEELLLGFLLHVADISNPAKDTPINIAWADLVLDEFFEQGDEEKSLNLPVSPLCDRESTELEDSQIGFIENIIYPTFKLLSAFSEGVKSDALPLIDHNLAYWRAKKGVLRVGE